MYTVAGTSRRVKTFEQLNQEVERLTARLDELEKALTQKLGKLQNEFAADMKRIELRMDEIERRNKTLLLRLEVAERRLQFFEMGHLSRPDIGFDKIGIA